MEKDAITQKCVRCGKHNRVLEMSMDTSGKGMLCKTCTGPKVSPAAPAQKPTIASSEREGYTCADCNYKFKSTKGAGLATCGYCGSSRVVPNRQNSAHAILEQAGARRYE